MIKIGSSRYGILLVYLMVSLIAFTALRGVLLIQAWGNIEHTLTTFSTIFLAGFIYDMAFNIYFCLFFSLLFLLVPNKVYTHRIFGIFTRSFFFVLIFALYFVLVAEWLFWEEFSTRFNFISVDYLIYRQEVTQNILESYPVRWLLAAIGALSLFTLYMIRNPLSHVLSIKEGFLKRLTFTLTIITLALLIYGGIDQSLRDVSDNNYVTELASNGPYQFVAAFKSNSLDYDTFYRKGNDDSLSKVLKEMVGKKDQGGGLYDISRQIACDGEEKRLNVVLITVESLSAKYLSRFGNEDGITPFMDQWFKEGLLFTNFYATGTRTTRGLEAITLSFPPAPGRSIVKRPDNENYYSLGKVFKEKGYDVAFLYGGFGFFDNMNAFFSGNGYRIVDQTDFTDEEISFKNAWGVSDEDLYGKLIKEANQSFETGKPFFFHVMTTSNHRPYTYLDGKIDITPGTSRKGAVRYTDYALQQLIISAKKQVWFTDTIFIVVADHCAGSAGKVGLPIDKYHIPLFIYAPGYVQNKEVNKIACQIDIAPTLLSLLNFNYKSYFFGRDILSDDFIERALIGNYQKLALYKNDTLVILSPRKRIEIINTPWKSDRIVEEKSVATLMDIETMSYYQGGNYILEHKLNKWPPPGTLSLEKGRTLSFR